MTEKGRLKRGKENYEAKKFLKNSETKEYINSLPKAKSKEAKNAKSTK